MNRRIHRLGLTSPLVNLLIFISVVAAGTVLSYVYAYLEYEKPVVKNELSDGARQNDSFRASVDRQQGLQHAVEIRPGPATPRADLGVTDQHGEAVTAACSTCHTNRTANTTNRQTADLDEFHQSLAFSHNDLSCLSCHNPDNYDSLRLADGTPVEYSDVIKLCAQCHGPQYRDYQHGAHGGMTGYWDLSRGPRFRNNCVDCHHPHTPQFPKMRPTFKPRDRFLNNDDLHGQEAHE